MAIFWKIIELKKKEGAKIIGFLTPKGELIACESWEHTSRAAEICKETFLVSLDGISAEDYILKKGYIVIRARDAYMNYYEENGDFRPLSPEQIKWLSENVNNFNEMQKKDIIEILEDMDASSRWMKKQLSQNQGEQK